MTSSTSLIHRYPYYNRQDVLVCKTDTNTVSFFLKSENASPIPLTHVWGMVDVGKIPPEKYSAVFSQMFPSITSSTDGSYSLHLQFKLAGGMGGTGESAPLAGAGVRAAPTYPTNSTLPQLIKNNPRIANKDIASVLRTNLTLASSEEPIIVYADSCNHQFPSEEREREARTISIKPFATFDAFIPIIKRVVMGTPKSEVIDSKSKNAVKDDVSNYMCGSPLNSVQYSAAETVLRKAFEEKWYFNVYVSNDGTVLDFDVSPPFCPTCIVM